MVEKKITSKKKVISLRGIVNQIELAQKKLKVAKQIASPVNRESLAVTIKNLQNIKAEVISNCPKGKSSFNIVVLPGSK
jgi:hypothetical protein